MQTQAHSYSKHKYTQMQRKRAEICSVDVRDKRKKNAKTEPWTSNAWRNSLTNLLRLKTGTEQKKKNLTNPSGFFRYSLFLARWTYTYNMSCCTCFVCLSRKLSAIRCNFDDKFTTIQDEAHRKKATCEKIISESVLRLLFYFVLFFRLLILFPLCSLLLFARTTCVCVCSGAVYLSSFFRFFFFLALCRTKLLLDVYGWNIYDLTVSLKCHNVIRLPKVDELYVYVGWFTTFKYVDL